MPGHWDIVAQREADHLAAACNAVRPVVGDVLGKTTARAVYAEALRRMGVPAQDCLALCMTPGSAKASFRVLRDRQRAATSKASNQPTKEGSNNHV